MQSSAVRARSNIVSYSKNNYRNVCAISSSCLTHKRHPIYRPNARVMGVFCGYLWENWRRDNGTVLYFLHASPSSLLPAKPVEWPCGTEEVLAISHLIFCVDNWDMHLNTLRPRQNDHLFADDIFKCIFLNENVRFPIKISLKFVPGVPINNIPALV